jgi:hypothetical protein
LTWFFVFPGIHDCGSKSVRDSLTFGDFIEENGSVLRILLSSPCHLFWLGDLETGTGRHLPLADFMDSLLLFSERFAQDGDCSIWDCCPCANIARLRDSAIGDVFHVLMAVIARPESLTQDGDAFLESVIGKVEGLGRKLCNRASPISPDFLNGSTAFTLDLGSCPELDDFLLAVLALLCRHYPQDCPVLI